jgi:hypothetical protein
MNNAVGLKRREIIRLEAVELQIINDSNLPFEAEVEVESAPIHFIKIYVGTDICHGVDALLFVYFSCHFFAKHHKIKLTKRSFKATAHPLTIATLNNVTSTPLKP